MGGPGLATKHHWMRVPMTEFPDTTNFAACGGYRAEIGFCRFLWLRHSGWPRQAFSPFFTALAASLSVMTVNPPQAPSGPKLYRINGYHLDRARLMELPRHQHHRRQAVVGRKRQSFDQFLVP